MGRYTYNIVFLTDQIKTKIFLLGGNFFLLKNLKNSFFLETRDFFGLILFAKTCDWPYVSNLAGSFSKAKWDRKNKLHT